MARGRRPGNQNTRGLILAAARRQFSEKGYALTSMRAIAREAGVDPALVHHYFTSKEALFTLAFSPQGDDDKVPAWDWVLDEVLASDRNRWGHELVAGWVRCWDGDDSASRFRLLHRAVVESGPSDRLGPSMLLSTPLHRLFDALETPDDERHLRLVLVASQLTSLGTLRWTLRAPSMVVLDAESAADIYGPIVQRFLVDELPKA